MKKGTPLLLPPVSFSRHHSWLHLSHPRLWVLALPWMYYLISLSVLYLTASVLSLCVFLPFKVAKHWKHRFYYCVCAHLSQLFCRGQRQLEGIGSLHCWVLDQIRLSGMASAFTILPNLFFFSEQGSGWPVLLRMPFNIWVSCLFRVLALQAWTTVHGFLCFLMRTSCTVGKHFQLSYIPGLKCLSVSFLFETGSLFIALAVLELTV